MLCEWIFLSGTEPGGEGERKRKKRGFRVEAEERKDEGGKTRERVGWGGRVIREAQVLLLIDPGAELGRAGLSETLPSAGERETHTSVI